MSLAYLEFSAGELRAWAGEAGGVWRPLRLDQGGLVLPLAVCGKHRRLVVGTAASARLCADPHLTLGALLTHLGQDQPLVVGRHELLPEDALRHVLEYGRPRLSGVKRVVVGVPAWLGLRAAELLEGLLRRLHLEPLAILPRCLLLALEAEENQSWQQAALLAEMDDAALTLTWLTRRDGRIGWQPAHASRALGRAAWRTALADVAAEACIQQCRRDPRAIPDVDQELFSAADQWLSRPEDDGQFHVQFEFTRAQVTATVTLTAGQVVQGLSRLAAATARTLVEQLNRPPVAGGVPALLLAREVLHLPGLVEELRRRGVPGGFDAEVGIATARTAATLTQRLARGELARPPLLAAALPIHEAPAAEFVFDADDEFGPTVGRGG